MDFEFFAQSLVEICSHSLVSPDRPLHCTIILNPVAGGFKIRSKWKSHVRILNEYREIAKQNPKRTLHVLQQESDKNINMVLTDGKNSGGKITDRIIDEAANNPTPFYLIISAGGDGTHSEVMFALYKAPAHIRSNIAVLKLPLGTGNDGADSPYLEKALDKLVNPVYIEFAPAVQLVTSPAGQAIKHGPYLAFNILSVGLDAYVTHMTNKMKGKLPGDSYRLWVDIAALFYDRLYNVDYLEVRALDEQNREIHSFREKLLLIAMGASGNRTYGSQQKILPDSRNVCGMKQMSLNRKLIIKGSVTKGEHINSPEAILLNAHRVEISGSQPLLAQMDGETISLLPEDFPVTFELTAPVIPSLKLSNTE